MKVGILTLAIGLIVSPASMGLQARGQQKGRVEPQTSSASGVEAVQARALLDKYCVTCHNQRTKAGSLVLESVDVTRLGENGATWEKVVRKLRGRLMPPAGRPRPDDAIYAGFTTWLETELENYAAAHPEPGRTETFRRLNRTEYQNAIRDLLALDIDASTYVPADDAAFGFDNIGGVFKLSPTLMESYLSAADKISRMAMGALPTVIDEGQVYVIPARIQQHDRIEGLPLGTRGGALIRHFFPQNAEYSFTMDLSDENAGEHTMELTIDGAVVKAFALKGAPGSNNGMRETAVLTTRAPVSAGPHEVGVAFYANPPALPEYVMRPFQVGNAGPGGVMPTVQGVTIGGPFNPAGPGDTPSRRRILTCRPATPAQEPGCAKTILSTLARRAFRRPLADADIKPLLAFYEQNWAQGNGFEGAIQATLWRLLATPEFLFRIEAAPPTAAGGRGVYRISDVDLASRLSFFLWSSIPDDRLLDLAAQGRLKPPAVLAREVRRMLADPGSEALIRNFAGQWLQLRKLESSRPGADYGKNFDDSLRQGLRRETELFFDSIVREDRPVTELLTANYTFLNERVAQHYGIVRVQGSHFRRVTLPADNPRRGLLGHGSILTLTSQGIRTSPVFRGKYILENILGTPPPEPPPDVPALPEGKSGVRPTTVREKMAVHRANPVCASCHSMLDPLGFGLENFDPVGRWREVDDAFLRIDASGVLPDGRKFSGATEFRTLLSQHPEQLATTLTEKLLTYAVGRGLEYYDMPVVRKVVREAARNDYRFHSIVLGIINSYPFQMRRAAPASPAGVSASR